MREVGNRQMRCPTCGKFLLKSSGGKESIRCIHCGGLFSPPVVPQPKAPRAVGGQALVRAKAVPTSTPQRPRFVNDRYALAPNPRSGGMALVYRASDMLDDNRQVAVKVLRHG